MITKHHLKPIIIDNYILYIKPYPDPNKPINKPINKCINILITIYHNIINTIINIRYASKSHNHPSPRPPVDTKTLAPTGLRSFVVHQEPRMVAVPQFLSPEESLGLA